MRFRHLLLSLVLALGLAAPLSAQQKHTFEIGEQDFLLDGKPFVIRCGEIHFPRVARENWKQRLQMCRAMGLNTVCVYLFWNFHEWEQGKYDWSGQADVVEFCRLAQEEGLWVILRPGPYSCAEWEMGGLPWWLLKTDGLGLRTSDPRFLDPASRFMKEVARVLGPQQITHGGPLLMVQVENEYGSFGNDAAYMGALRQSLLDGGFNVPLFACNPAGAIGSGFRDDLFQVVNFGAGAPKKAFDTLRKFQKNGPLMNGEYYPAWFDMWGRKHRTGPIQPIVSDLQYMLENRHSFSIYMAHGGTSFGLWSGADRPFSPDTSSYDYDAPISEAGWVTPKFTAIRELFAKHLQPGETLPDPPAAAPVISIPEFKLTSVAPLYQNLPEPKSDEIPKTMEFYDQSRGCILYRTTLPAGPAATLSAKEIHDFAWIRIDGKPAGVMDRRSKRYQIRIPARSAPVQLDVFIEAMGRVNFGKEVFDRKGLIAPVTLHPETGAATELNDWKIFNLPLGDAQLAGLKFKEIGTASEQIGPAFWRGTFSLDKTGDTFLDVRKWGKGVVWVNGHCLGRYWNIGPTQTMYLPQPWLKTGENQIVILDLLADSAESQPGMIAGLEKPILDELHPELDFARPIRAKGTFSLGSQAPVLEGSFAPEPEWQTAKFANPAKGRYLCIEPLDAHDGKSLAAIAELVATDARGEVVSKSTWNILAVDSEDLAKEPGNAENVLDGQPNSYWITQGNAKCPHHLVIDLGESRTLGGIRYLSRAGDKNLPGRVKNYRVYLSETPYGLEK